MAESLKPYVTKNEDLIGASVRGTDGAEYLLILNIGKENTVPDLPCGFELFSGRSELASGEALLAVKRI